MQSVEPTGNDQFYRECKMEQYFKFLDELRETGSINMFGAPAVLREEFGLSKAESYEVFKAWTEQFRG